MDTGSLPHTDENGGPAGSTSGRGFVEPRSLEESTISVVPHAAGRTGWNDFIERWPESTFCHRAEWREILSDVLGLECLYKVAIDGTGRWLGVLPLVRVRSRIFDHYLLSMPFLNYGGPVGTRGAQARLADAALDEARRSDADHLELRARHAVPGKLQAGDRKVTVLLELPEEPDTLWEDHFRSKLRSQIRKPMKEGMEARFGPDQVDPFYDVFAAKMRDLGTPVLPRSFFEATVRLFGERVGVGAIYHGERPVAAGFGFFWRHEFEMTWAASLPDVDRLAPNMLLYWSFMEHAIGQDAQVFNFGRCTPGEGTHRFKKQWGGEDVPLPWLHWSAVAGSDGSKPDGVLVRAAISAWQRMPLFVANRAGPMLARNLPL